MEQGTRWGLVAGVVVATGWFLETGPIAQDLTYHQLTDPYAVENGANICEVLTSLFYIIIAILGLTLTHKNHNLLQKFSYSFESLPFYIFFLGIFLTGLGSAYYHFNPNNEALIWDRLPMKIAFMSAFSILIMERIHRQIGLHFLPYALIMRAWSVAYWIMTEHQQAGDLRPYLIVQFFPLFLGLCVLAFEKAHYTAEHYLWGMMGWYAVANVSEICGHDLVGSLGQTISGHTLKHLASAISAYQMVRYLQYRNPVSVKKR